MGEEIKSYGVAVRAKLFDDHAYHWRVDASANYKLDVGWG
jgi:hypothetical protein